MQIEGIPDGWELVRVGKPVANVDWVVWIDGTPKLYQYSQQLTASNWPIVRKIEKPKRYRPFANAAEFEPHRDRWIKRSHKDDSDNKLTGGCFRVAAYDDDAIWTVDGETTSYEAVFKNGKKFEDGTPFGVEVVDD